MLDRSLFDSLRQDAAYAARGFRREPGVALIALLILALGIGANTAVFSIVNPLLLRPLPFPRADRLVWIANTGTTGVSGTTYRVDWYEELRRSSASFEDIAAYFAFFGYGSYTLTGPGEPEHLVGVDVGPRFFEVLGVSPALGRLFDEEDHQHSGAVPAGSGGPRVALLGHGLWQRRFGRDPNVLGTGVIINNKPITIAGVLPDTFDFSSVFTPGTQVDFFVPADLDQIRPWGNTLALVGRLRREVGIDQARAELATLIPRLNAARPDWGAIGARVTDLREHVSGGMRTSLIVLWCAVAAVLLIVCANLANLLLARAAARSREFAVRVALGASRRRIVRQLLTEGLLLATAGALLGIPLAVALTAWFAGSTALNVPLLHYARVDTTALVVTAGIACLTGVLFAVVPALKVSMERPQALLQEYSRGAIDSARHAWIRKGLVVAEIGLAALLLVGAGLLARSFVHLLDVDLGFEPSRTVAARIAPVPTDSLAEQVALERELVRRVSTLPGVEAAGLTDALPLDRNRSWGVAIPGKVYGPGERPSAFVYVVSPGYMRAMGIAILRGRDFLETDPIKDRDPVIVNATLARTLYPNLDPVGRPLVAGRNQQFTIVGVVADVRQSSLDEAAVHQLYFDLSRGFGVGSDLIVRSAQPPASLATPLRNAIAEIDSRLVASDVRLLDTLVDRAVSPRRFLLSLIGGFSLFALLLASLGIYGVISYGVSRRTPEIGVRMALGASGADVRRTIVGETMRLALAGLAIGVAASLMLTRTVASLLYATSPTDPATFGTAILVLAVVALIAGYLPALRASRIDPMRALRSE